MKIAIMQPYFFPYIGYWQLINAADCFVVYDNIQYTKKGWFNRNRFLQNGKDEIFSIPLKKDSDYLNVDQRIIAENFDRRNLISRFQNAYAKAPYKKEIMPVIEHIINYEETNLFLYIYNSIKTICNLLEIKTPIIISSSVDIDHTLRSSNKVQAICKALNANCYINPEGGTALYDKEIFERDGIKLQFLKSNNIIYKQFNNDFVERLSIIDVLMFNSPEKVKEMLNEYELF